MLADGLVINAKDNTKPMLSQADRTSFQRMQWKRFALKVAAALRDEQQMITNDQALALCDRAAYYGFTRENAIYKVVRALHIDQDKIETEICKQTITKDNEENIADQLEKLCERI